MAKTTQAMHVEHPGQTEAPVAAPDDTKKQRKKQAKREAKMMLKLDQARQDVQKAEQKVAKAQTNLESTKTHLSKLEAQVQELSAPATSTSTPTKTTKKAKSAKFQQQEASAQPPQPHSGNHAKSATSLAHEATTSVATGKRGKAKSATPTAEPERPDLLSPDVAHTDTDTVQEPTGEQATSTSASENKAEQPALLSPDVAHTDTDTSQEQTEAQSTPAMEENSVDDGGEKQDEAGDGDDK